MAYFKINNIDFSSYVNQLTINTNTIYNEQVNASGNIVVDYINSKREIEIGIIPISNEMMKILMAELEKFNVSISFRNPKTGILEDNVNCIIPSTSIDYYTIQDNKVMYNGFNLTFKEL